MKGWEALEAASRLPCPSHLFFQVQESGLLSTDVVSDSRDPATRWCLQFADSKQAILICA